MQDSDSRALFVSPAEQAARQAAGMLGLPVWTANRDQQGRVILEGISSPAAGRAAESPRADDIALFLHTSGTTSRPKGVPLTHGNLTASMRNIARALPTEP